MEAKNEKVEQCGDCEHLLIRERYDMEVEEANEYWCGHYDLFELDNNEPVNNFIGFLPVCPDWCPLRFYRELNEHYAKLLEPKPVHYVILEWNQETLKYTILHYTHSIEDFEAMTLKYPASDTIIHLIPLNWVKSHDIMLRVKAIRERNKQL